MIQRNVWQTNKAFASFYHHSCVGDVLHSVEEQTKFGLSTDLLMVNPNKTRQHRMVPSLLKKEFVSDHSWTKRQLDYGVLYTSSGSHNNVMLW
jgi:hypothetical protein